MLYGGGRNSLVASMNALVEEFEKTYRFVASVNTETNPGITKFFKKYEKMLTKVVDFSSSSDSENYD
jgi:hypothetical protein